MKKLGKKNTNKQQTIVAYCSPCACTCTWDPSSTYASLPFGLGGSLSR